MDMEGMTNKNFELMEWVFWLRRVGTRNGMDVDHCDHFLANQNRKDERCIHPQDFMGWFVVTSRSKSCGVFPAEDLAPPRRPCVLPADLFVTMGLSGSKIMP